MKKRNATLFAVLATAGALSLAAVAPASGEPLEPCESQETSMITGTEQELIGQVQVNEQELTPCI